MRCSPGVILFILLVLAGCSKTDQVDPYEGLKKKQNDLTAFGFQVADNSESLGTDVVCTTIGNQITCRVFPSQSRILTATFSTTGASVKVAGIVQESGVTKNDFSQPVTYSVVAVDGSVKDYTVRLSSFTGLPVFYINTTNELPIISKKEYVTGHLTIEGSPLYPQQIQDAALEIRGRGNSTWDRPDLLKKSYKIKLRDKTTLLNMPADKEWVLLANYSDKTLMRNHVAFELSRRFGLTYTPRGQFVDLYLNNEYKGNYLLAEQIDIAENKVNIQKMSRGDISQSSVTGGYLLEIDGRRDADFCFYTRKHIPFCIKSPENIVPEQLAYIKDYLQTAENAIYSEHFADPATGYAKYIDTDSFINWFLVNELFKNTDAKFALSVYMYKDRNEKLCLGPVWDFDIGAGNVDFFGNDDPTGWWVKDAVWIHRLFEDPAFKVKVQNRWNTLKGSQIETIGGFIDATATYLHFSQRENFKKWDILNAYVWPNAVVMGSYEQEVAYLKEWLMKRRNWLDSELNQ